MMRWYEEISNRWVMESPFLFHMLSKIRFIERKDIDTIGIRPMGTRLEIIYNLDFINALSNKEKEGVILHEIMHILYLYNTRINNREHKLFNVSQDICINEEILKTKIAGRELRLPENGCFLSSIPEYEGVLQTEAIYNYLMQKGDNNGKGDGKGKMIPFDIHDFLNEIASAVPKQLSEYCYFHFLIFVPLQLIHWFVLPFYPYL